MRLTRSAVTTATRPHRQPTGDAGGYGNCPGSTATTTTVCLVGDTTNCSGSGRVGEYDGSDAEQVCPPHWIGFSYAIAVGTAGLPGNDVSEVVEIRCPLPVIEDPPGLP